MTHHRAKFAVTNRRETLTKENNQKRRMTFPDLFKLYIWLVDVIRKSNGISLEEINRMWTHTEIGDGKPLSRSSFMRHKEEIADIFGINIVCVRDNGYKYYLDDRDIFKRDTVQNWMISTLSVNNVLCEGLSLSDRILIESIPSSTWLSTIIESMKSSTVMSLNYKKYKSSEAKTYTVEPYCVKLFRRRWYMLGIKLPEKEFRTFSLDRILSADKTPDHFVLAPNFSAEEFYSDSFGIVHDPDTELERIVIRAFGVEAKQMRDLPIHSSQQELPDATEAYADYEITLRPTGDFISYLVGRGTAVKVLEPLWLADQVRESHKEAMDLYSQM